MLTPLRASDEVDLAALPGLIEHILSGGVAGLFVLGTTGEAPSLSYRLRYQLVEEVCQRVAGRVPVLVGITDSSFQESVELSQFAADCGAQAVVAAPPYYFPMLPGDLARYFLELAEAVALPLYLYNMPACTKVAIDLETTQRCLPHPNIVGFKDSGGDWAFFEQLLVLREARPDWSLFVGPEHLTGEAVLRGGDGGVNGGANLFPKLFTDLYRAAAAGDRSHVATLQLRVEALGRLYQVGTDFVSVARSLKCALSHLGICRETMERPFTPYGERERAAIGQLLEQTLLAGLVAEIREARAGAEGELARARKSND